MTSARPTTRSGYAGRIAQAALLCAALLAPARAAANEPAGVVAPGQDALLAQMLGLGVALPGPCTFTGGAADGPRITSTYDCPAGAVTLELRQKGDATSDDVRTAQFAITVRQGSPPAGFLDALTARIAAREAAFAWTTVQAAPHHPRRPFWMLAGEGFFALLIGAVAVALWRSRRRIHAPDALVLALLVGLALLLRCIAHGGPADIRAVLDERSGAARAGWVSFFLLMHEILPAGDETIWNINRVIGALSVPLLYLVMRRRFANPVAAVGAAAALAVTPLIARFSASDTPYILLCAAWLGALVAYDRYVDSESPGALALALGLLTAAVQLRPDAGWLLVPTALVAAARPLPRREVMLRPSTAMLALLFLALNALPTVWAVTSHASSGYWRSFVLVGSVIGSPWLARDMTPPALAVLVGLGAVAALFHGRAGLAWLAAVLVAEPLNFSAYYGDYVGHYANARYHLPAIYLACGLAGLGVAAVIGLLGRLMRREVPARQLVAVCIVFAVAAPGFDVLQRMWTLQREYEVFRSGLHGIDPQCRVVTLLNVSDAGFVPFDYLAPERVLDIRDFLAAPAGGSCAVYYRAGNCYGASFVADDPSVVGHPACFEIERQFHLEPIIETPIPALAYRGETYTRDPLPVGFYRLRARDHR